MAIIRARRICGKRVIYLSLTCVRCVFAFFRFYTTLTHGIGRGGFFRNLLLASKVETVPPADIERKVLPQTFEGFRIEIREYICIFLCVALDVCFCVRVVRMHNRHGGKRKKRWNVETVNFGRKTRRFRHDVRATTTAVNPDFWNAPERERSKITFWTFKPYSTRKRRLAIAFFVHSCNYGQTDWAPTCRQTARFPKTRLIRLSILPNYSRTWMWTRTWTLA